MPEKIPHRSTLAITAISPATWTGEDHTRHRRVLVEVRGVITLTPDDAASLAARILEATRAAERA